MEEGLKEAGQKTERRKEGTGGKKKCKSRLLICPGKLAKRCSFVLYFQKPDINKVKIFPTHVGEWGICLWIGFHVILDDGRNWP